MDEITELQLELIRYRNEVKELNRKLTTSNDVLDFYKRQFHQKHKPSILKLYQACGYK